eukprot:289929_1
MSTFLSFFAILASCISLFSCDVIPRDTPDQSTEILCTSFPCIINCNADNSCHSTNISCPLIGDGNCTINLIGVSAAHHSIINTGNSSNIYINSNGQSSFQYGIIYANNKKNNKLIINGIGDTALQYSKIYTSYGDNSELSMLCGNDGTPDYICSNIEIYDHFSTNINLQSHCYRCFYQTEIRRNPKIAEIINYRGYVNIYASAIKSNQFEEFIYYGTDHGNWTIESRIGTQSQFLNAIIFADHSFVTDDSYTISVISEQSYGISNLKLYAAQNNVNIKLIGYDYGFWDSTTGQYFNLICSSSLQNIVINKLSMIGYGTQTFVTNFINITYPIRQIEFISNGSQSFYNIQMYFGNVLEALTIFDTQYRTWYSADITFNNIMGDVEFISNGTNTQSFQLIHLVINNIFGNLMFYDSSNGYAFRSSNININHINGSVTLHDISLNGYSFYNSYFSTG